MTSKKDQLKKQAQQIAKGDSATKPQAQALQGQHQQQPQNLALSQEAMGNILAATNQAIAALSQASAPLGYQKGVELSQAMNQFPLAMQQGFQEHQAATMGRFGSDLETFQRDITAMLEANSAPALPATNPRLAIEGAESTANKPQLKAVD